MIINRLAWVAAAAFTLALWGCSPDQVSPNGSANVQDLPSLQGDEGPHPVLFPQCSATEVADLAKLDGEKTVDGSGVDWGNIKVYNGANENGDEVLAVDYTLATNWYIAEIVTFFGDPATVQTEPNGMPIIDGSWAVAPVNPVINAYQTRTILNGLPDNNTLMARVKVGQLDWIAFDGSLDASTIQYLWVWNDDHSDSTSHRNSSSQFELPWTIQWCNVSTPQGVTLVQGDCNKCESENTVTFAGDCLSIDVTSCKNLSNVVLVYDDCTWQKFDGLSSKTGTFSGTGSNAGKVISHAYIKSGCFKSNEGPGFGLRFNGPCLNSNCGSNN